LRRVLPPAPQISARRTRRREPAPFPGDLAAVQLRQRPSLDPVTMPAPPLGERGSAARPLARVAGAVGLAALAAFFMVGTTPLSFAVKAEGDATPSLWTRLVARGTPPPAPQTQPSPTQPPATASAALDERFAAMGEPQPSPQPRAVQTVAVPPAILPPAEQPATPRPRALDREEIAILYRRSEELIAQGDIAAGRLLLTRAAEAGDARAALALGATYDAAVLGRLGVLGVAPDAEKARAWYAKSAEFGSREATQRLEQLAQSER
jgi:hypothetical protein